MQSYPGLDKTLAYNASRRGRARRAQLPDSFLFSAVALFPSFSNFMTSKAGDGSGHRQEGPTGHTQVCLTVRPDEFDGHTQGPANLMFQSGHRQRSQAKLKSRSGYRQGGPANLVSVWSRKTMSSW